MTRLKLVLAAVLSLAALPAFAAGFENIVISATEGAEASDAAIPADAAKIFMSATITDDVDSGTKLTVAWIAVDVGAAAPANTKVADISFDVGAIDNHVTASISKPDAGWPVGSYAVQFIVDGELMETAPFTVQ